MPNRYYSNTAVQGTLTVAVGNSDTTIVVSSVSGHPVSFPYTLVLDEGEVTEELVEVTSAAGLSLVVTRGIDGTSASTHSAGATVKHVISARDLRETQEHMDETSTHGVTGDLVGTSDEQTLTNKTLALGDNDVSGSKAEFNAALTDDDFATLTGTETLTNKTLTSPTVNDPTIKRGGVTVLANSSLTATWFQSSTIGADTVYYTHLSPEIVVVTGRITADIVVGAGSAHYLQGLLTPESGDNTVCGTVTYYNAVGGGFADYYLVYHGGNFFLVPPGGGGTIGSATFGTAGVGDHLTLNLMYRV